MEDISQDFNTQYSSVLQNYKAFIQNNYFAHELAVKFSKPLKVRAKTLKVQRSKQNKYSEPMYYIGKPIEFIHYPIHSRRNTDSPQIRVKPNKKPKQIFIDPFNPNQKLSIQRCIESPILNGQMSMSMSSRQKSSMNSVKSSRPSTVVNTRHFSVSMTTYEHIDLDRFMKNNISVIANPDSVASLNILNPRYNQIPDLRRDSVTITIPTVPISLVRSKRGTRECTFSAESTHSKVGIMLPSLKELNSVEIQIRRKYPRSRSNNKSKRLVSEIDKRLMI